MAIKKYAQIFFKGSSEREIAAARSLGPAFDISRAGSRKGFRWWIVKPDGKTSQRFALGREVLVVYSAHPTTDSRALVAFKAVAAENRDRVDPLLGLIVHSGSNHDDFTSSAHRSGLDDDRVFIVERVDELLADRTDQRKWLSDRIARRIGEVNLFSISSPLSTDSLFFGRDDLVHRVVTGVSQSGSSYGLFGLRKSGKTSILFAIERRLPAACDAVFVDCQSPGIHRRRWWSLLHILAQRFAESVGDQDLAELLAMPYTKEDAAERFRRFIVAALDRKRTERIVFLLDEIDFIVPNQERQTVWNEDFVPFWQTIRSVRQEMKSALAVVCAGVNGRFVQQPYVNGLPNPILEMLRTEYIAGMTAAAISDMIGTIGGYMGISFTPDAAPYLQRYYGGHPYLCRIACDVLCGKARSAPHLRDGIDADHFRVAEVATEIRERSAGPLRDVLLSLALWHPDEYDVLTILALDSDVEAVRQWRSSDPGGSERIRSYGIADLDSGEFLIRDLKVFLASNGDEYRREVQAFSSTDVDPDLIPEMANVPRLRELAGWRAEAEGELRRLIVRHLAVLERNNAGRIAARISDSVDKNRRETVASSFVGRTISDAMADLYLLDLTSIIGRNWEHFSFVFSDNRKSFESSMHLLNSGRIEEAHSKPFDEEDFRMWKTAYEWLLGALRRESRSI